MIGGRVPEIPPRARRREVCSPHGAGDDGNTSACEEKRTAINHPIPPYWKYLRVRGEELPGRRRWSLAGEIPPRARRRVWREQHEQSTAGNTSACAEKSSFRYCSKRRDGEIPPRARRRVNTTACRLGHVGNTSACAEKSVNHCLVVVACQKYLRVRGEEPRPNLVTIN